MLANLRGSQIPPRLSIVAPGATSQARKSCHFLPRRLLAFLGAFAAVAGFIGGGFAALGKFTETMLYLLSLVRWPVLSSLL